MYEAWENIITLVCYLYSQRIQPEQDQNGCRWLHALLIHPLSVLKMNSSSHFAKLESNSKRFRQEGSLSPSAKSSAVKPPRVIVMCMN